MTGSFGTVLCASMEVVQQEHMRGLTQIKAYSCWSTSPSPHNLADSNIRLTNPTASLLLSYYERFEAIIHYS